MKVLKFLLLASLSVVVFDAAASVASLAFGFSYSCATIGSAILCMAFAFSAARMSGFRIALLTGMVMGVTDVTIGWAVSWAIGPGRIDIDLTPSVWMYTLLFAAILGVVYGVIGGGIGLLVGRRRAA